MYLEGFNVSSTVSSPSDLLNKDLQLALFLDPKSVDVVALGHGVAPERCADFC